MAQPILQEVQVRWFQEQGFLGLPQLASLEEVAELRAIFDRLFASHAGWKQGKQFDMAGTDETLAHLPQILDPSSFAPELRTLPLRERALGMARQLLGPEAAFYFEHAILKPARHGAPTPWHQDEAHRDADGVAYEQISIWIPLCPATRENGCMCYIPRSHLGEVLSHHSPGDDPRIMALECCGSFNEATAVPCPLPPGGAAIHHARTLHSAGPNDTDLPRPAYILAFRGPDRPDPGFQGYSWNREKKTAAQQRNLAWQNRGGPLGRLVRRASRFAHGTGSRLRRLWR